MALETLTSKSEQQPVVGLSLIAAHYYQFYYNDNGLASNAHPPRRIIRQFQLVQVLHARRGVHWHRLFDQFEALYTAALFQCIEYLGQE